MANSMPELRTCTYCLRTLPIDAFRRRYKGTTRRHTQCDTCHAAERRQRRKAAKEQRVYQFAKDVIDAKRSRNQVLSLTAELFRHFGGPEELARTWKRIFDEASAAGRKLVASKLLIAIVELHTMAQQLESEQQADLDLLTDEELQRLVDQQRRAIAMELASDQA